MWKVPAKGGSPLQVTRNGGLLAAESKDGRFLYYSKSDWPGIWRMSLRISFISLTPAIEGVDGHDPTVTSPPPEKSNLEFLEFATGKRSLISTLDRWSGNMGMAVSPDGESVLFVKNDLAESSIMLVKNFH